MKISTSTYKLRQCFNLILVLIMVLAFIPTIAAANEQLATPTLIPKGEPSTLADGTPGNPARHTQFRSLIFEPVQGATGYTVYAYASRADAENNTNPVAFAQNIAPTIGSQSGGGTQGTSAIELTGDEVLIDVRLIQFEAIEDSATRTLPVDYTPAGLGDSYFPGDGSGNKTNLKPGQYWFRLQAVDNANSGKNSNLSEIYADGDAFSISVGPDEAADILAPLLAAGKLGDTPDATLRIVDLRGAAEISDEGYLRFSEGSRIPAGEFNTVKEAEALFGHINNKDAVSIFILCRGGGRAVTAARHLANAGYTNVYNMEGVNQWTLGLMYDDETFRFRQASAGDDGDLGKATNAASPEGIGYDEEAGLIRWYNIPGAKFNIYAFTSPTQTNAVAMGTLPALVPDLTGSGMDWRFVRTFDLSELNLPEGTYYIRVQALPEVDVPIKGYTPETNWGAPSKLSDPVELTSGPAKPTADSSNIGGSFVDVNPDDWFYTAAEYSLENNIFLGVSGTEFGPHINITGGMFLTVLYRTEGSPVMVDTSRVPLTQRNQNSPYYADAVTWAHEIGLIDGLVGHDNDISRARLAIYLYKYATYKGYDTSQQADLSKYTDANELSDYALPILKWANATGLISGRSETVLAPYGNTTRAEAAAILMRFLEGLANVE